MSNLVHLINDKGEKKVVESKRLNESVNDNFRIDIDWYLSNGYTPLEDAIREIEGSCYEQPKFFVENEKHDFM